MSGQVQYDFSNKVVVVTGGLGEIGAAICARFLACGAVVSIWDQGVHEVAANRHFFDVEVRNLAAVQDACDSTIRHFGKIDIVIQAAGFGGELVSLETSFPETWRRVIEVNLLGTYHVCRTIVPFMREVGSGRIINIAALAGKEGEANASAFSAAEAGVIALTKSLGKELGGTGILVNVVVPGTVDTMLLNQLVGAQVQGMVNKCPLGRLGRVAEVAEMMLWLASDACTFNTGAVFDLSGGRATY
ncbi:SDR family NAD(P)-dependent oxidoreductase [Glaciimonas sp. PCH181]|uniref:SDR family oxidoreductase n=1 Tax=Glaciimonas sp. PCH181 TaxID=2133943 RepID=UPI000D3C0E7D|nr:SDR family NAD(P)-dependent oxidoreductase [Glaciimonas sp. PCH181]PUA20285.1 3-oxoacyl-ACP reductase [Glaciimonas sp. PCH181]